MINEIEIFENIVNYVYPISICNKLYMDYAIFIFNKQHFILFNGLPNNFWGNYPSNESIKDKITITGLKQINRYHDLVIQNPDKLYHFDALKNYKLSKAKWYTYNIESNGYINDVDIKLNNLTDIFNHKLDEIDIYSYDNILEILIDNLKRTPSAN